MTLQFRFDPENTANAVEQPRMSGRSLLGEKSPLSDRRIKTRQNRDSLRAWFVSAPSNRPWMIGIKFEDGGRRQPPVLLIPLYLSSGRKWDFVSVPATFSPSHTRPQSPAVFFAIFRASFVRG